MKNNKKLRIVFTAIYSLLLALYLFIGFQPVDATVQEITGQINIAAINLDSEVTTLEVKNRNLETPDYIVGAYSSSENKTLLIGHSTTVFQNLAQLQISDEIIYNSEKYIIYDIITQEKSAVNMQEILAGSTEKTIILMTCAGELLPNADATHRLLVYAKIAN